MWIVRFVALSACFVTAQCEGQVGRTDKYEVPVSKTALPLSISMDPSRLANESAGFWEASKEPLRGDSAVGTERTVEPLGTTRAMPKESPGGEMKKGQNESTVGPLREMKVEDSTGGESLKHSGRLPVESPMEGTTIKGELSREPVDLMNVSKGSSEKPSEKQSTTERPRYAQDSSAHELKEHISNDSKLPKLLMSQDHSVSNSSVDSRYANETENLIDAVLERLKKLRITTDKPHDDVNILVKLIVEGQPGSVHQTIGNSIEKIKDPSVQIDSDQIQPDDQRKVLEEAEEINVKRLYQTLKLSSGNLIDRLNKNLDNIIHLQEQNDKLIDLKKGADRIERISGVVGSLKDSKDNIREMKNNQDTMAFTLQKKTYDVDRLVEIVKDHIIRTGTERNEETHGQRLVKGPADAKDSPTGTEIIREPFIPNDTADLDSPDYPQNPSDSPDYQHQTLLPNPFGNQIYPGTYQIPLVYLILPNPYFYPAVGPILGIVQTPFFYPSTLPDLTGNQFYPGTIQNPGTDQKFFGLGQNLPGSQSSSWTYQNPGGQFGPMVDRNLIQTQTIQNPQNISSSQNLLQSSIHSGTIKNSGDDIDLPIENKLGQLLQLVPEKNLMTSQFLLGKKKTPIEIPEKDKTEGWTDPWAGDTRQSENDDGPKCLAGPKSLLDRDSSEERFEKNARSGDDFVTQSSPDPELTMEQTNSPGNSPGNPQKSSLPPDNQVDDYSLWNLLKAIVKISKGCPRCSKNYLEILKYYTDPKTRNLFWYHKKDIGSLIWKIKGINRSKTQLNSDPQSGPAPKSGSAPGLPKLESVQKHGFLPKSGSPNKSKSIPRNVSKFRFDPEFSPVVEEKPISGSPSLSVFDLKSAPNSRPEPKLGDQLKIENEKSSMESASKNTNFQDAPKPVTSKTAEGHSVENKRFGFSGSSFVTDPKSYGLIDPYGSNVQTDCGPSVGIDATPEVFNTIRGNSRTVPNRCDTPFGDPETTKVRTSREISKATIPNMKNLLQTTTETNDTGTKTPGSHNKTTPKFQLWMLPKSNETYPSYPTTFEKSLPERTIPEMNPQRGSPKKNEASTEVKPFVHPSGDNTEGATTISTDTSGGRTTKTDEKLENGSTQFKEIPEEDAEHEDIQNAVKTTVSDKNDQNLEGVPNGVDDTTTTTRMKKSQAEILKDENEPREDMKPETNDPGQKIIDQNDHLRNADQNPDNGARKDDDRNPGTGNQNLENQHRDHKPESDDHKPEAADHTPQAVNYEAVDHNPERVDRNPEVADQSLKNPKNEGRSPKNGGNSSDDGVQNLKTGNGSKDSKNEAFDVLKPTSPSKIDESRDDRKSEMASRKLVDVRENKQKFKGHCLKVKGKRNIPNGHGGVLEISEESNIRVPVKTDGTEGNDEISKGRGAKPKEIARIPKDLESRGISNAGDPVKFLGVKDTERKPEFVDRGSKLNGQNRIPKDKNNVPKGMVGILKDFQLSEVLVILEPIKRGSLEGDVSKGGFPEDLDSEASHGRDPLKIGGTGDGDGKSDGMQEISGSTEAKSGGRVPKPKGEGRIPEGPGGVLKDLRSPKTPYIRDPSRTADRKSEKPEDNDRALGDDDRNDYAKIGDGVVIVEDEHFEDPVVEGEKNYNGTQKDESAERIVSTSRGKEKHPAPDEIPGQTFHVSFPFPIRYIFH